MTEGFSSTRFAQKNALITGAAAGLGRHTARAFVAERADIAILDFQDAAATAREITALGRRSEFFRSDVRDEDGADILVSNAGFNGNHSLIKDMPPAHWRATIEINLTGTMLVTRTVLPFMLDRRAGAIVTTASNAAVGISIIAPTTSVRNGLSWASPRRSPSKSRPTTFASPRSVLGRSRAIGSRMSWRHAEIVWKSVAEVRREWEATPLRCRCDRNDRSGDQRHGGTHRRSATSIRKGGKK